MEREKKEIKLWQILFHIDLYRSYLKKIFFSCLKINLYVE